MNKSKMPQIFLAILLCLPCALAFAEDGVTETRIVVGMSTALTGPASFLGTSFRTGAEAYFGVVNEKGGINGRKIKLIVYDDGYEPGKIVPNINKLIKEDKVFCLFGNVGTPTAMAIKPIIIEEKVPLFAPFTGAEALRNPVVKYILNYRASYNQEAEEFIKGIVDVLGHKRIGVFYQNDSYGNAVLKATRTALQKRGLEPLVTGTYQRNTEDVSNALNEIMKERPEAVVMVGTYAACAKFIIEGKKRGFNPIYMNVSFVGPDKLAEMLGKYGENVVVTQVVPPFDNAKYNYAAVQEYMASLRKYFPDSKPSFGGLEGFLAAKVFVEGVKRAGKNLTRESFISAVEGIKDLDIKAGNKISFSAQNHQGSQKVYPSVIKGDKYVLVEDWKILSR
ncbi:MAG: extracellular ligand-binding receptor [Nitrospirae bacterium]|nr:MAG: extracellular ligand-binding receptor [Nitrospirota bacterium]